MLRAKELPHDTPIVDKQTYQPATLRNAPELYALITAAFAANIVIYAKAASGNNLCKAYVCLQLIATAALVISAATSIVARKP